MPSMESRLAAWSVQKVLEFSVGYCDFEICLSSFQSPEASVGCFIQKIRARSAGLVANEDESFGADGRMHKRVSVCILVNIYIYIYIYTCK